MMWQPSDIKWFDCEISSLCNAGCVDCNRWIWNPQNGNMELNSFNQHMDEFVDVDRFEKRIQQFPDLKFILLQGNVGDPMTHPNIADIVKKIFKHFPNIYLEINSNGSVGSQKSWKQMCELTDYNIQMCFSIDGLEDTNHIYRRGCDWNKIMRNTQMWIDHGGRADWKMLDFPYNAHQREQARELAKQMGFESFYIRERYTRTEEMDNFIVEKSSEPVTRVMYDQNTQDISNEKDQHNLDWLEVIDWTVKPGCRMLEPEGDEWNHWPNFHMNVEGTLWPCCFTSNLPYIQGYQRVQWEQMNSEYVDKYGPHWNNLDYHSLEEILSTDWFDKDLPNSWTKRNSHTLLMCHYNCGDCNKSYVWNDPANPIFTDVNEHKNKLN